MTDEHKTVIWDPVTEGGGWRSTDGFDELLNYHAAEGWRVVGQPFGDFANNGVWHVLLVRETARDGRSVDGR